MALSRRRSISVGILMQSESVRAAICIEGVQHQMRPDHHSNLAGARMEKVSGIGGIFFRARDPESLSRWYQQHLGITPVPTAYDQPSWQQTAGDTVFAPFPADTKYFGKQSQAS